MARHRAPDQARRYDDHEIGLVLAVFGAAEQCAQYRNFPDPWQLPAEAEVVGLQQSSNCEALTVAQLDGGLSLAYHQSWDLNAANLNAAGGVEFADLRFNLEIDQSVGEYGRREL